MIIGSSDIDKLRGSTHTIDRLVVNAVPLQIVATAQINQSDFTYPLAQLSVDNVDNWGDVEQGMMVVVGTSPGLRDVTCGIVRVTPTSSTLLKIDAKSQGDSGFPTDIHMALEDNFFITVYSYRPPWGLLSSIRKGVFYKSWDLEYSDQGLNPDPIVRLGGHVQGFVDQVTGKLSHTFSVDPYCWNKSLSGISWDAGGGAIIGSSTSDTCSMEFIKGFYIVKCTITDNRGKSRTAFRYVWANSENPDDLSSPLSYRYPLTEISSDSQDGKGRSISLRFSSAFPEDVFFPGQAFFLKEYPHFGGEELEEPNNLVTEYFGYSESVSTSIDRRSGEVSIALNSPLALSRNIPAASQQLSENRSPTNWTQCGTVLSNSVGAFWYISAHHCPYLIDCHDFTFDPFFLKLRRKIFQFSSDSIGSQLEYLDSLSRGLLGCKSDGTLTFRKWSFLLKSSDRDALSEKWQWEVTDITGEVSVSQPYRIKIGQVYGYAYSFDGSQNMTPYASLAPGYSSGQSPGKSSIQAFTVTSDEGQDEVNRLTGHYFAKENQPSQPITIRANRNLDFSEPCETDVWHRLNVSSSYDIAALGWGNDKRIIPVKVSRRWKLKGSIIKEISVEFEAESFGIPGITVPVDRGGANSWQFNKYNPGGDDLYDPVTPEIDADLPFLLAWNSNGQIGLTKNPFSDQISWKRLMRGMSGKVMDITLNYKSQYFTVDRTKKLECWAISKDRSDIKIFICRDVLASSPQWSLQKSYSTGVSSAGKARIKASRTENFAIASWKNTDGVHFARFNGSSWDSSAALIGSSVTDLDHGNDSLTLDLFETTQIISAPTGYVNGLDGKIDHYLYVAVGMSATFSQLSLGTDERVLLGASFLRTASEGLVAIEKPAYPSFTPVDVVTFDSGGYPHYSVIEGGGVTEYSPGDNKAWDAANLAAAEQTSTAIEVQISMDIPHHVTEVSFETFLNGLSSVSGTLFLTRVIAYDNNDTEIGRYEVSSETGWVTDIKANRLKFEEPVSKLQLLAGVSWEVDSGSGIVTQYLDNINISAIPIENLSTFKLQSFSTSGTIGSDYTPEKGITPTYHYALTNKPGNVNSLSSVFLAKDTGQRYIYRNTGTWEKIRKTSAIGCKRFSDEGAIFFGQDLLAISDDLGMHLYSLKGNWSQNVGEVATVEGVLGVIW